MKTIFRLNAVSKALSTAALLAVPLVATAGIGNIRVQSGQGEPLSATVALSGDEAEAAVLNGAFSATGSVPLNVRVSGSQEQPVLVITSSDPITEEITSLSVRAGDSVRLYSVALKPQAPKEEVKSEEQPQTTADNNKKEEKKAEPKAEEPKDNSIALGSTYTTKRKETVRSIAVRMTNSKASNQQKIQAIVDKNPDAFLNGNPARMKSGVTLTIPTADEIANVEKKLAEKAAAEKAKREAEAEKAKAEKLKKEQEAQAKREAEEKAKAEKAEAERLKKEQEAAAAAEQAQREAEAKAAQEKAEAERLQAEQAAQQAAEPAPAPIEETPVTEQPAPVEETPVVAEQPAAPEEKSSGGIAKYVAGGLLALAVIGGFLLARRKGGGDDEDNKQPSFQPTGTVAGTVVKPTETAEEETVSLKDKFFPAPEQQTTPVETAEEEVAEDISTVELPNLDITQPETTATSVSETIETAEETVQAVSDEVVEMVEEPIVEAEPAPAIEPLDIDELTVTTPPAFTADEIATPQATQEGNEFVLNFGGDSVQQQEEHIETPDNTFDFDFSDNDLQHPKEKLDEAYRQEGVFGEPSRRDPSVEDVLEEGEKQKLAFDPNIGLDFILDDTPVAETIKSATQDENYEEPVSIRQYDPAPLMRLDSDLNISETLRTDIEDMTSLAEEPPAPLAVEEPIAPEPVAEEVPPVVEEVPPAVEEVAMVEPEPVVEEPLSLVEEPVVVEAEPEEPISLVEEALESLIEQAAPAVEEVSEPEPIAEVLAEEVAPVEEIPPVVEEVAEEPALAVEPPAPTVEEQAGTEESPIPVATEVVEEVPSVEEVVATPVEEPAATTIPLDDTNAPLLAKLELAKMYLSQNDTEGTLEVLVDILDSCPPDSPIYKEAEKMFNTLDT